jgi:uncharacterized damage-inducible protein DinB
MGSQPATSPTLTPEGAKFYLEGSIASLEHEWPKTKEVFEAITQPDFKLDPKARTAKEIAWHIVCSDLAFLEGIAQRDFTVMTQEPPPPATIAEVISYYESNLPKGVAKLRALTLQQLTTPLEFFGMFNFPCVMYLGFLEKHHIHHRAQLAASLRPMGSKVPSIYGGSADVPFEMPGEAA